ncbi:MAG: FAD-binding domain-containing protein [Cyanobacteria bacterium P01_A01_bin.37]
MSDLILFWHRRDLRISDNIGLAAARQRSAKVVGVFCLDPNILDADNVAPARVVFMLKSIQCLEESYARVGGTFLIIKGTPEKRIPALANALSAQAVYWNRDVEPYSKKRDEAVQEALNQQGIQVHTSWDQLLYAPGQVLTGAGAPYTVYTPFWRNWNRKAKDLPADTLYDAQGLNTHETSDAKEAGSIALPSARDFGFRWDNPLPLEPGEKAAQEQLEAFCDGDRHLLEYDDQRNFPSVPGTSMLSAAFKFGTIGIRTVWQMVSEALSRSRSDDTDRNIQTWQQELAWREFYQHAMYFFPSLAEGPYRAPFKDFPWDNNEDLFEAWCTGRTGYPIVDAAMRQLNETGWMHNRCRMIVASFLTKDLIIDWRWGEKYFMQTLVDGDLSANNGGWQWSASSGMDPKPLRIFNPASQSQKFDRDADYIRQWLPEIRSLDTGMLVTGAIPEDECDRYGYPTPVVNHKQQQAVFKQLYKQQKEHA